MPAQEDGAAASLSAKFLGLWPQENGIARFINLKHRYKLGLIIYISKNRS